MNMTLNNRGLKNLFFGTCLVLSHLACARTGDSPAANETPDTTTPPITAPAPADASATSTKIEIALPSAENVSFWYGDDASITLLSSGTDANSKLTWSISQPSLPAGLSLQTAADGSAVISGKINFVGDWCAQVLLSDATTGATDTDKLCLLSTVNENDAVQPPRFLSDRILPTGKVGQAYSTVVRFEDTDEVSSFNISADTLPSGLNFVSSASQYLLQGTPKQTGDFTIVARISMTNSGMVLKQFELHIDAPSVAPPVVAPPPAQPPSDNDSYTCPPNSFYNGSYCEIESTQPTCGSGQYYDPDLDTCRNYSAPPTYRSCAPGQSWDSYLNVCYYPDTYRCPVGYYFDRSFGRCVRDNSYYSCAPGWSYDYGRGTCVSVYEPYCAPGYRSNHRGSCVPETYCSPGSIYDPTCGRCLSRDDYDRYRNDYRNRHRGDNDWDRRHREDEDRRREEDERRRRDEENRRHDSDNAHNNHPNPPPPPNNGGRPNRPGPGPGPGHGGGNGGGGNHPNPPPPPPHNGGGNGGGGNHPNPPPPPPHNGGGNGGGGNHPNPPPPPPHNGGGNGGGGNHPNPPPPPPHNGGGNGGGGNHPNPPPPPPHNGGGNGGHNGGHDDNHNGGGRPGGSGASNGGGGTRGGHHLEDVDA